MTGLRNGHVHRGTTEQFVRTLSEFLRQSRDAADAPPTSPCKCATPEVIESTRARITLALENAFDAERIRRVRIERILQEFERDGVKVLSELEGTLTSAEASLWHWTQQQHGASARDLSDHALGKQAREDAVRRAKHTLDFCLELRNAGRSEKLREIKEARSRVARVARSMSSVARLDCHGQLLEFERVFLPWNDGNPARPVPGYEKLAAGHDTHADGPNGGAR